MPAAPITPNSKNPLRGAVEILPDRLYYCALRNAPSSNKLLLRNRHNEKVPVRCFCIDDELVYWNFFLDYGPLNLGQLYRFTVQLNHLLQDSKSTILFYSSSISQAKRANAIFLICAWQVLELRRTPEQAFYGFSHYSSSSGGDGDNDDDADHHIASNKSCSKPPPYPMTNVGQATVAPLPPFHDASPCACAYELNILHCLQGLVKAKQFKFFDWDNFDLEEYEYYEQVENGDLNWIVQGKIMAFAGPSFQKTISPEGYCTLAPSDYIPYFRSKNVGLVVRLNKKMYEELDFVNSGIDHLDQFYLDGSCPPMKILQRVLRSFESVPSGKGFAVHCKAGLGRTGTCIGAYLMKHYRMTAPEVISWMRICRPGSVIGPQQQFLQDLEPIMWQEGEMMRKIQPSLPSSITSNTSTNKLSPRSSKKKHLTTSSSSDQHQPTTKESASGRPGQADGLLAARRQRQQQTTSSPPKSSSDSSGRQPAPITPDVASSKKPPSWVKSSS